METTIPVNLKEERALEALLQEMFEGTEFLDAEWRISHDYKIEASRLRDLYDNCED